MMAIWQKWRRVIIEESNLVAQMILNSSVMCTDEQSAMLWGFSTSHRQLFWLDCKGSQEVPSSSLLEVERLYRKRREGKRTAQETRPPPPEAKAAPLQVIARNKSLLLHITELWIHQSIQGPAHKAYPVVPSPPHWGPNTDQLGFHLCHGIIDQSNCSSFIPITFKLLDE